MSLNCLKCFRVISFCAAASAAACILRMTFGRNGPSVRSSVHSSVRSLTPISHDREELFKCGFLRWDAYISGTNYTKNHLGGVKFFGTFFEIYKNIPIFQKGPPESK